MSELPTRRLGERTVSAVGLGCMPLSDQRMLQERERALSTVHAALDAGITLLDTANIYAPSWDQVGHNESLVAEALRSWDAAPLRRDSVLVLTKGGITRGPGEAWGRDASPEGLLAAATASAERLGGGAIDLYLLHRADPAIPYRQQVRALARVRDEGVATAIGLSNVTLDQMEVAIQEIGGPQDGGVVAVQNEYSPRFREAADVREECSRQGIAYLPWSPLGGGSQAADVGSRFGAFADVASAHGVTPQQVVIAWHLAGSPVAIPIPGSTRPATITASAAAANLTLTDQELAVLDATESSATSQFPDEFPPPPLG